MKKKNGTAVSNGVSSKAESVVLRRIMNTLTAVKKGDFSVRLRSNWSGVEEEIADSINEIITANERMAQELRRISQAVGKQGKIRQRAKFTSAGGAWSGMEDSINSLIDDLVWPTLEVTRSIGAVAKGDLTQTMGLVRDGEALEGEFLRCAQIVNRMIGQLSVFTSEVTRVAREV